jgi:hypothetical protein
VSIHKFESTHLVTRRICGNSKATAGFTGRCESEIKEKGRRAGAAGLGQIQPSSAAAVREQGGFKRARRGPMATQACTDGLHAAVDR